MIEAICTRDVERADALAHAHARQFRHQFLKVLRADYTPGIDLGAALPKFKG